MHWGDITATKPDVIQDGNVQVLFWAKNPENPDGELIPVTQENADEYIYHYGNSNGQVQPVRKKLTNAFAVESGNVWKMSKDLFHPAHPTWGRSMRGGSWYGVASGAWSAFHHYAFAGYRLDGMGFSLARTCTQ